MVAKASTAPLIVVTGGAGFIGSHTVDSLVEDGYQVVVLDDLSTGNPANLARWGDDDRVELVKVDISDGIFAPLAAVTARRGPVRRMVHLAAQTSVVRSVENPLMDARVNYLGTMRVLEYARAHEVERVVFASSAAVYGDVTETPVHEEMETAPLSPYGIDKRASELLLQYYSTVHGIPTTAFRFFNVYGPRQDPTSPYTGVISIFAERAIAGADLTIFGDGEQTRDFICVRDIVRAITCALESERDGFAVANLGTGVETSVNELARVIVESCGASSAIRHAPARAGEIARSVASVERARRLLSADDGTPFEVARTTLADGLAWTLDWMQSRP